VSQRSKYAPLFDHLNRSGVREVTLTFTEIEALLGGALPGSARSGRAWWSNRDKGAVQAAAWMAAGYHVVDLDLASERVTFRKPIIEYHAQDAGDDTRWKSELIRSLRAHMRLTQKQFADVLGVRQQTVSEWESGVYVPTRSTSKHLTRVAKEAGFIDTAED
jgi:DNA-binding transcriptional regulator YiaG